MCDLASVMRVSSWSLYYQLPDHRFALPDANRCCFNTTQDRVSATLFQRRYLAASITYLPGRNYKILSLPPFGPAESLKLYISKITKCRPSRFDVASKLSCSNTLVTYGTLKINVRHCAVKDYISGWWQLRPDSATLQESKSNITWWKPAAYEVLNYFNNRPFCLVQDVRN